MDGSTARRAIDRSVTFLERDWYQWKCKENMKWIHQSHSGVPPSQYPGKGLDPDSTEDN